MLQNSGAAYGIVDRDEASDEQGHSKLDSNFSSGWCFLKLSLFLIFSCSKQKLGREGRQLTEKSEKAFQI